MSFVAVPDGMLGEIPKFFGFARGNVTAATVSIQAFMTFDASTDKAAWIGRIPKTGTITELLFHTGTVSTAGATFRMRIETVDASGLPSGTLLVANAEGTVVVGTSDDNAWQTVSINGGTGVSVTKNQRCAIVLEVSSGTPNTVGVTVAPDTIMAIGIFPYIVQRTAGAYAKSSSVLCAPFMINYGGTYQFTPGMCPVASVAATNVGNGNERALRFRLPVPMQIIGVRAYIANQSAGADHRIVLYDATPTLIAEIDPSTDLDGDHVVGATNDGLVEYYFDQAYDLQANTTYYLSIYQKTANNLAVVDFTVDSAAHMAAAPGGAEFYLGTRSGGSGTFSDTTTTRPLIHLIPSGVYDQNGDGSGGGGGGGLSIVALSTRSRFQAGVSAVG